MFSIILVGNCIGSDLKDFDSDSTMSTLDSSSVDMSSSETQKSTDNTAVDSSSDSTTSTSESSNLDSSPSENDSSLIELKSEDFTSNERIVSIEEISSKVEKEFGNVSNGETKEILTEKSNEKTVITEVQFTAAKNLTDVKVTVIKLKDKPESISLLLKKNESVYHYLDVKLTSNEEYITEDDIETLTFTFKIEKSWITENNINKKTIFLMRYHDGEWQNLSTTLLSENETYIIFKAVTPGCSTFAVVGSTLVEIPEPFVTEAPEIPWMVIIGVIASTTIILVTVLFKARYIYFEEGPHKAVYFEGDPHKLKNIYNNNVNKRLK
jgi:PGF-pre-PGF domain-containing protein